MAERKIRYQPVLDKKGQKVPRLFRYITGTIYVRAQFRKLGIPDLFQTTGESTLGRAKVSAEVIIQQHKNKCLGVDDSHVFRRRRRTVTIGAICDLLLSNPKESLRTGTQSMRKYYFEAIKKEFGFIAVNHFDPTTFDSWVEVQKKKGERKTFFDYAKHLNMVLKEGYEKKYATHLIRVKNPDPKTNESWRVYTEDEITRLWNAMGEDTQDQFILCYECFMRKREALLLLFSQINLENGEVTLSADNVKTGSKTGHGRQFFLSPRALMRMQDRRRRICGDNVFPSPTGKGPSWDNKTAWRLAKTRAGVFGKATWHSLRHTAITRALLEKGANINEVSKYAGVGIKTLTRVYLHGTAENTRNISTTISIPAISGVKLVRMGK